MSWITRCPACATTYKVVPDQLKVAKGWLRCGQCQHVFDSTGVVLAWPETASSLSPSSSSDQDGADVAGERLVIDELLKQEDRSSTESVVTVVAAFEEALSTFKSASPLPNPTASADLDAPDQRDGLPIQSTQARPRSLWATWGAVTLLVVLALQWLWIERHTLAALQPAVGRAWHGVCHVLGCEVELLQVREGVVIDHSSLIPSERGYWLSWSVRNATPQALQMPALELILLDAQDKALVRRVFDVSQLNAPPSLAPGQIWEGQLHLAPEADLLPAGYRLFSFYP